MKQVIVGLVMLVAGIGIFSNAPNEDAKVLSGLALCFGLFLVIDGFIKQGVKNNVPETTFYQMVYSARSSIVVLTEQLDRLADPYEYSEIFEKLREGVWVNIIVESADEQSRDVFAELLRQFPNKLRVAIAKEKLSVYGTLVDDNDLLLETTAKKSSARVKNGDVAASLFRTTYSRHASEATPLQAA
jgi:hypothetical protein